MTVNECLSLPIWERRWYVDRFILQKNKENEAMQKAKSKK